MLSVLVWVTCALLMAQALLVAGASALLLAPGPLLVSALIWALLWNPRVVLPADGESVVVRNPLRTVTVPMAAIQDVRLGAMLRLRVADGAESRSRVITAWNAPGTGKDDHRDRLSTMGAEDRGRRGAARRAADLRGGSSRAGAGAGGRGASPDQRSGWAERLVRDQRASPSYAVVEAWETWRELHGDEAPAGGRRAGGRRAGASAGSEAAGEAGSVGRVSTKLNTDALSLVATSTALVVVRVLF